MVIMGIGAATSMARMLYVGRKNESIILLLMFVGWVLAPFIGWLLVDRRSKSWSERNRLRLYILMIVVTIMSVVIYSGVINPINMKPAFVFLVVPCVTLIVIVLTVVIKRHG